MSVVLVLLGLLSASAQPKLKVVVSLPSFADLTARVGGDEVEVLSLIRGDQDPHFSEAKADTIVQLGRADLLIRAGLGLEDGWLPPMVTAAKNARIRPGADGSLDVSTLVRVLEVPPEKIDRSMGDVHPLGNPHFMLDPRNGVKVARGIAERLAQLQPANAAAFRARSAAYEKALLTKITQWSAALRPVLAGKPVLSYHRGWSYFGDFSGMNVVAVIEPSPGLPPVPDCVARLSYEAIQKKIGRVLVEPFYPTGIARQIASGPAAKVLVLPPEVGGLPGVGSYIELFDRIVKEFAP